MKKICISIIFVICIISQIPQNTFAKSLELAETPTYIEIAQKKTGGTMNLEGVMSDFGPTAKDAIRIDSTRSLISIINKFLGVLQLLTGFFTVIILVVTGFDYVIAPPDVKVDIKEKMLPIIIGMVLTFSATTITQFIFKALEGAR